MGLQSVRSLLQPILCSECFYQRVTVPGCVSTSAGLLIAYLLLTMWCRILKQLIVVQLVTKFPDFIGNRKALLSLPQETTNELDESISCPSIVPEIHSILPLHLHPYLRNDIFPSCSLTKTSF